MKTRILTIPDTKDLFTEMFLNKVGGQVTKISDHSALNAMAYGISSVAQKAMKDTALMEAQAFPEYAYGEDLDIIANRYGIPSRYGPLGSSVYLRVVAEPGTVYDHQVQYFETADGVRFIMSRNHTIGYHGYDYIPVKSVIRTSGANVDANKITKCINAPAGHKYCINEFMAIGGRDTEDDLSLKSRISQSFNIHTTDTLARLEQILIQLNPNVFSIKKVGRDSKGIIQIAVHSQNGGDFTPNELDQFKTESKKFLSLTDVGFDFYSNVTFVNGYWKLINFDFRVLLAKETDQDELRKNIQIQVSQFFDWRRWNFARSVKWTDLFFIIKNQKGARYLPDQFFNPKTDIMIKNPYLPRISGFVMRNLDGNVIADKSAELNPVYYQNYVNAHYISTSLSNL